MTDAGKPSAAVRRRVARGAAFLDKRLGHGWRRKIRRRRVREQYRELTPEQYAQGFVVMGGWRVPFGPIVRRTENGTIIVKEPKPRV